jgi:phospholipase/carboxylesterase
MAISNPLPTIEIETGAHPTATIIWLHGLGADGNDFVSIVPELGLPEELSIRFLFPHAPMRPVTINKINVMRAWYDVVEKNCSDQVDEVGLRESIEQITTLIYQENARGIPTKRIVVGGFSQGGAVALSLGIDYPEQLAGVIGLSTYLPFLDRLSIEASHTNCATPIFMAHGTDDRVVPIALGDNTQRALCAARYPLEWRTYATQHSACWEEIIDIGDWLIRHLT